jgi:DNA methylase
MIYSVSDSQDEILNSISRLYLPAERFTIDTCYNKGGFYASGRVSGPEIKNDLYLLAPGLTNFDVRNMPYSPETIKSIIFDPPFLVGSIENTMIKRYGGFTSIDDMWDFQMEAIQEISRVLKKGGILVTKIQDFVYGKMKYFPSIRQVSICMENNLMLIDSFIFINKNRLRPKNLKQLTSVSAHCYFNVYRKKTRLQKVKRY